MKRTDKMPWLVYVALLGINSKPVAYIYAILSLLLGVGCIAYGFVDPIYFNGAVFVASTGWYVYAIRWVEKFASWHAD